MLRVLALLPQAALLLLVAYNLLTALPGLTDPPAAPPGERRRRFRVVVPAHDEGAVVAGVLDGVGWQDYDPSLVSTWVVADRCTDDTAAVAARHGANVATRLEGPDGKGAALRWYLAGNPLADDEALVVLDADNRLPRLLLARLADELDSGHPALQAYLDTGNPDASWLATGSALSYWASNRMVQMARTNLGWPADLGGTGMCVTAEALAAVGGFSEGLTEDRELTARLALFGFPPRMVSDVRVSDEKPASLSVAVLQRARWLVGARQLRRQALAAIRTGLAQRSPGLVDLGLRMLQPSRTVAAALTLALLGASAFWQSPYLVSWPWWLAAAALQLVAPVPFLLKDRVPARYVWRYPLMAIFALLWLPVRIVSRRTAGWYHTPHHGISSR